MKIRNTRHMMIKLLKASTGALCLIGLGLNTVTARELIGLDYSVMTGNAVQLVFTFDENAIEPRAFTIDEPARIALDFADTANSLRQRNLQVGIGAMQSIISASSQGRTRVVLNLTQKTNYVTSISGNQMTLTLAGSTQSLLASSQANTTATPASITSPQAGIAKGITNIDFKRGPNGEGALFSISPALLLAQTYGAKII